MLRRRVRIVRAAAIFAMLALAASLTAPASAVQWNFETLDGSGGPDGRLSGTVGSHTATTVWNGEPHVWYQAPGAFDDLRHAWYG